MPIESLGLPLASGHTAEVFAWKEGYVLKLFREGYPLRAVEQELCIARIVNLTGLPAPAVGDIIEIEGCYGLVYERVPGASLIETMSSRPWKICACARFLAELHVNMHGIEAVQSLPSQHCKLKNKILDADILPADEQDAVLRMLEELPEGSRLCHGDFHPDNVMMTEQGPLIIDWVDATRGNPGTLPVSYELSVTR